MIVRRMLRALVIVAAERFVAVVPEHMERAGHAEMHEQHVAGGEIGEEIFGAPAEPGHGLAFETVREVLAAAASADRRGALRPW